MLTEKQKRFVKEYLIDLNATAAARRAGFSYKNADKIGYQLLGKTRVSEAIKKEMSHRAKNLGITADRVLNELAKLAFVDITQIVSFDSKHGILLNTSDKIDASALAAVKSITHSKHGFNLKFYNKLAALKLLGDYFGLWTGNVARQSERKIVGADSNLAERLKASIQRQNKYKASKSH